MKTKQVFLITLIFLGAALTSISSDADSVSDFVRVKTQNFASIRRFTITKNATDTSLPEISIDRAGIEISSSVRIRRGTYRISDLNDTGILVIKADNLMIDLNGAELIGSEKNTMPDEFSGFGIVSNGHSNITLRNGTIRGFKVAIYVQGGENVVIEDCDVSDNYGMRLKSTPEREDGSDWLWPHHNDQNEWMTRYGGGIVVEDCTQAIIRGNCGHRAQNGIILDATNDSKVYDNDFSFNSGWGLAMWRSSRNEITYNKFDWCVRGYSHGVYARGQDSAGILIFEQCNDNIFAYNSATHSGDGFFLYAGHETTERTGEGGCNRNTVYRNDFSHAVANGIEATFSDSNWFIENILNDCNYGVWGGYSYNTRIAGNQIGDNSIAGVAIEHGHNNLIEDNSFRKNPIGVNLWWSDNAVFLEKPYGQKQNTKSENNRILQNRFEANQVAISLTRTSSTMIDQNDFVDCDKKIRVDDFSEIKRQNDKWVKVQRGEKKKHAIRHATASVHQMGRPRASSEEYTQYDTTRFNRLSSIQFRPSVFLPEGSLRGRQYILIDEWGPYDFSQAKIWPEKLSIGASGTFYLYGPESAFTVVNLPDGISVEPLTGTISSTTNAQKLDLRVKKPGFATYDFGVQIKEEDRVLRASVTAFNTKWNVKFFHWEKSKDPREDQAAWDSLLETEPIDQIECSDIDFSWQGGKPSEKVNANYFGVLATTNVHLPAGNYEIRTMSDDGIRVWVDDERIIDNWTWHGPTEDVANVTVKSGVHKIQIEHFQIDGWSVLSLKII